MPTEPLRCRVSWNCWRNCKFFIITWWELFFGKRVSTYFFFSPPKARTPTYRKGYWSDIKVNGLKYKHVFSKVLKAIFISAISFFFYDPWRFPDGFEKFSPPILQLDEADFWYSSEKPIFKKLSVSADLDSRICVVSSYIVCLHYRILETYGYGQWCVFYITYFRWERMEQENPQC